MKLRKLLFLLVVSGIYLAIPGVSFAEAIISEIMYDLPGADTGREWIEVQNTGSDEVSFFRWKLFEANTNHGLTLFQGSATTTASGFAVIADDPVKFLTDNPQYSGTLFGSSFSLSNTGETLELKVDDMSKYQAVYASSTGGAGDGNSLHWVNNNFVAGAPSPGSAPVHVPTSPAPNTSGSPPPSDTPPPATTSNASASSVYTAQISVSAFVPQRGVAGAPILFDAAAIGIKKEPLPNARYAWSFGDGGTAEGKKVYHTYHYPAAYTVLVDASSGEWSATDRKEIAIAAPLPAIAATTPKKPIPEPTPELGKKETASVPPIASSTLPAQAGQAGELLGTAIAAEGRGITPWLLGVGLLILISIGAYLTTLRPKPEPNAAEKLRKAAEEFEIVE